MYPDKNSGWPSRAFKCKTEHDRIKSDMMWRLFKGELISSVQWELKMSGISHRHESLMAHRTGTSILKSSSPPLAHFWRATSTFKSEMVCLRSSSIIWLLLVIFVLRLHWLKLFLLLLFCGACVLFPCVWQNSHNILIPWNTTLVLHTYCCWLIWLQDLEQCGVFLYGNDSMKCVSSELQNLCGLLCYDHEKIWRTNFSNTPVHLWG